MPSDSKVVGQQLPLVWQSKVWLCQQLYTQVVRASPVTQCGIMNTGDKLARVVLCLKGAFDIVSMERIPWTNQEQDI